MLGFRLEARDGATAARAGRLHTAHGEVETPVFMPVGTQAAVRGLTPRELREAGARIVLANTYHLLRRPGSDLVRKAGGLHPFMGWDGPVLTDSGGYQAFSLPGSEILPEGVRFKHGLDGSEMLLTPAEVIRTQHALGADIIMPLDECTPYPASRALARRGIRTTLRWLAESVEAHDSARAALFGIVQGSVYPELRRECADGVTRFDLPGYAIGGVSVGEGLEELKRIVSVTVPRLPEARPRYLMGVGLPEDLIEAVEHGMDMFDCVIPTRFARSATLFTCRGRIRMTHRRYRHDLYPVDASCGCYTCRGFSRAYLHHLYQSGEILGTVLGGIHNVSFYSGLMRRMREAILGGELAGFKRAFLSEYLSVGRGQRRERA